MALNSEIEKLSLWMDKFPRESLSIICQKDSPMYVLDLIVLGAVKRSLSISNAMLNLVKSKNMVCARALLRMHIDTISRLYAYLYVDNPEEVAQKVLAGDKISQFKSNDGKKLTDSYLISRLSESFSWIKDVYRSTSAYVHFSEKQLFDSIKSISEDHGVNIQLLIATTDEIYLESSWEELAACFNHLNIILVDFLDNYAEQKKSYFGNLI